MFGQPPGSGPTIRFLRPEDLPVILATAAQTGWEHLSPSERALTTPADVAGRAHAQTMQALSMPGAACFVAEENDQVVAYELVLIRPDEVSGVMEGLKLDGWVHPAYRGRGLNRLMHQTGEDWCISQGVRRMVVQVAAHNQASLKATDKSGFETVRVIRAKWLEGRPAGPATPAGRRLKGAPHTRTDR